MESTSPTSNSTQWLKLYEQGKIHKPGVYYDMPREEYLKDCSCNSSAIRNVIISPLDCWVESPMNPDHEEEMSDAKEFGIAFHIRLLDGVEIFGKQYAAELDPTTLGDDVLTGGEQLRAKCADLGVAKNGTLMEMSKRIIELDPGARCFPILEAEYNELHKGKKFLKAKIMRRLEIAAKSVEQNPEIMAMLEGTEREVSLFWVDEQTGVPMKARLDAFKPGLIVDLKSFANLMSKPLELALTTAISQNGYGVQAITYQDGLKQALGHDSDFAFIFQESGRVPNVAVRDYDKTDETGVENAYYKQAYIEYRKGIKLWAYFFDKYGTAPWVEPATRRKLGDTDFPAWHFN